MRNIPYSRFKDKGYYCDNKHAHGKKNDNGGKLITEVILAILFFIASLIYFVFMHNLLSQSLAGTSISLIKSSLIKTFVDTIFLIGNRKKNTRTLKDFLSSYLIVLSCLGSFYLLAHENTDMDKEFLIQGFLSSLALLAFVLKKNTSYHLSSFIINKVFRASYLYSLIIIVTINFEVPNKIVEIILNTFLMFSVIFTIWSYFSLPINKGNRFVDFVRKISLISISSYLMLFFLSNGLVSIFYSMKLSFLSYFILAVFLFNFLSIFKFRSGDIELNRIEVESEKLIFILCGMKVLLCLLA